MYEGNVFRHLFEFLHMCLHVFSKIKAGIGNFEGMIFLSGEFRVTLHTMHLSHCISGICLTEYRARATLHIVHLSHCIPCTGRTACRARAGLHTVHITSASLTSFVIGMTLAALSSESAMHAAELALQVANAAAVSHSAAQVRTAGALECRVSLCS